MMAGAIAFTPQTLLGANPGYIQRLDLEGLRQVTPRSARPAISSAVKMGGHAPRLRIPSDSSGAPHRRGRLGSGVNRIAPSVWAGMPGGPAASLTTTEEVSERMRTVRLGGIMKPLVYLAAPYSCPDPASNTVRVLRVASDLYDSGLVVPLVPHLTLLWDAIDPRPVEHWYRYDLELLRRSDAILRLSGASYGADQEVAEAVAMGLPTFSSPEDLLHWAQAQPRHALVAAAGLS